MSKSVHRNVLIYLSASAFGALIAFWNIIASPSESKNAILFGYSIERILLSGATLALTLALLLLTLKLIRNPESLSALWRFISQRRGLTLTVVLGIFFATWISLFAPYYRLGKLASYRTQLVSILVWILAASCGALLILFLEARENRKSLLTNNDRRILKLGVAVFIILLIFAAFVAISGIGIAYPADYWYGAGVPVLGLQALLSILIGATFLFIERKISINKTRLDWILFILIWVVAAIFWAREPLSVNYFLPSTDGNPIYPYSDSATFDLGAQYALIGQGLFNNTYFDRALYSAFLTYLHLLWGQNFSILLTAQALLFAVFPALVYLIGKELHSRALGISAGMLIAFRGINAIVAARWIDTSSPKMMLTDFPTAIGIAAFIFFLLKWIQRPEKNSPLIWAGAIFGLTLMARTHALPLLPLVLLGLPFALKLNWKKSIQIGALILIGLFAVTLPWEIRNQSKGIPMFYMYYYRIEIILKERYGLESNGALLIQDKQNNANLISNSASNLTTRLRTTTQKNASDVLCENKICSIADHFIHNVAMSFLYFPSTFVFDDLWNVIKSNTPYWKKTWDAGTVNAVNAIMLIFNAALIAFGAAALWRKNKAKTFLIISVFLAYLATNSLGFTSGGRYIVPVDWIVCIFYVMGALQIFIWFYKHQSVWVDAATTRLRNSNEPSFVKIKLKALAPALFSILLIGALIPASDWIAKPRYEKQTANEILDELERRQMIESSSYTRAALEAFLAQPDAMIRAGRALYPRAYSAGEGEQDRSTYYRYLDYQRLAFTLIGPYSEGALGVGAVMAGLYPPLTLQAQDVVVLGCWNTTYYAPFIDAAIVFITTEDDSDIYIRNPEAPLQCPFAEPQE